MILSSTNLRGNRNALLDAFRYTHIYLRRYTLRVRVQDRGARHEDEASVTISVLDPVTHLAQLLLAMDSGSLVDAELVLFEQYAK